MERVDGKIYSQGTSGLGAWSGAGILSDVFAQHLYIGGNHTNPESEGWRVNGLTVRSATANNTLHKFPFSLPYSGFVNRDSGATIGQGSSGPWWFAGVLSDTYAYYLDLHGNITNPTAGLYKTYGLSVRSATANNTLHKFPFSLPYSGDVNRESGATVNQGTSGYWWGAGLGATPYARRLGILGNYTNPEYENYKTYGFAVRCVATANNTLHKFPFSLPYSGNVGRTNGKTSGSLSGYFWAAATTSGTMADHLYFDNNYNYQLMPSVENYRTLGFSVRHRKQHSPQIPILTSVLRLRVPRLWCYRESGYGRRLVVRWGRLRHQRSLPDHQR